MHASVQYFKAKLHINDLLRIKNLFKFLSRCPLIKKQYLEFQYFKLQFTIRTIDNV